MTSTRSLLSSTSMLVLLFAAGCTLPATEESAAEEVGEAEEAAAMARTQNTHNSLHPYELFYSPIAANPTALAILSTTGLQAAMSSDYMQWQLHSAYGGARAMKYIVSCALPAGRVITSRDPFTNQNLTFEGEIGLCEEWQTNAPSPECRELVSACVLARVNATGKRIPISLHGAGVTGDDEVMPERVLKNKQKVASFDICGTVSTGPNRNCGWWPVGVYHCHPGQPVVVGAGADVTGCGNHLGSSSFDSMLRVCSGIHGCDAAPPPSEASYNRRLGSNDDTCGYNPSVSFECPSDGFFSVMGAAYNSSRAGSIFDIFSVGVKKDFGFGFVEVDAKATDAMVFKYVEGAFYGDIFDSTKLEWAWHLSIDQSGVPHTNHPPPAVVGQTFPPLYKGGYACYSAQFSEGEAHLRERMCTAEGCLMNVAGACREQAPGRWGSTNRCEGVNALGVGEYDNCHAAASGPRYTYTHPLTTYLYDPCDATTSPASCQINAAFAPLY